MSIFLSPIKHLKRKQIHICLLQQKAGLQSHRGELGHVAYGWDACSALALWSGGPGNRNQVSISPALVHEETGSQGSIKAGLLGADGVVTVLSPQVCLR